MEDNLNYKLLGFSAKEEIQPAPLLLNYEKISKQLTKTAFRSALENPFKLTNYDDFDQDFIYDIEDGNALYDIGTGKSSFTYDRPLTDIPILDILADTPPRGTIPEQARAKSAHHFRSRRLRTGAVHQYVQGLHLDEDARGQVTAFSQVKVELSKGDTNGGNHRALTPFIAGLMSEKPSREALMSAVDLSATQESEELKELARENNGLRVDVLIVGAGVQGAVAAARIRAENPELAILSIDKSSAVGGQFRSYGQRPTFRINSRAHRPDDLSTATTLPGQRGNLNPFGNTATLQLPDITSETYPTNMDMGDAVAINHYFAVPTMLEVDLTARTKNAATGSEKLTIEDISTGEVFSIDAQKVILATGSGERAIDDQLPTDKVWTVEKTLQHFGNKHERFPMKAFVDKSIAIIGGGDSGRIVAELFTRLAPKEAYGSSVAQLGNPESISWYGVNFASREEFCEKNRSRYELLRAFIANDGERVAGARMIQPKKKRVTELTEMDSGAIRVCDSDGAYSYFDIVIDARNLTSNTFGIEGIIPNSSDLNSEITGIGFPVIGQKLTSSEVYIAGPAADTPLTTTERSSFPASIRENTVAIWANSPRVEEIAKTIARTTVARP